jgi:hypothetical protein
MYGPMLRHCSLPTSCCEADAGGAALAPIGMAAATTMTRIQRRFIVANIAFGDAETLPAVLERRLDPVSGVEGIAESPGGMTPERIDVHTGALLRRRRQLERRA